MSKHDYNVSFVSRYTAVTSLSYPSGRTSSGEGLSYIGVGKRVLDVVFALLMMPVVLPVIAIFAMLIALDGGSPFYAQNRVGKDGRTFRMWKLRTMVADAEARLDSYLATSSEARTEWEVKQKLQNDPRITRLGRVLRRTSMDELPQFLNVLGGDMSIVGPRPMMECQKGLYPGRSYFDLRPGVTGPWQVSDRNNATFADRACFDDAYRAQVSFASDLRLIVKTVLVVFRGTGC